MEKYTPDMPRVMKETKNKIRVDFDRSPLAERLKAKFLNTFFYQKVVWYIFRLVLLVGIAYIILFPFFSKISGSFMAKEDFVDTTVRLIPKNWTLDTFAAIIVENNYLGAFVNTLILSLSSALLQTMVCCFVGYGLAKFRFKGNSIIMLLVVLTMIIPHRTIQYSLQRYILDFDIFGIFEAIHNASGAVTQYQGIYNTFLPLILLSLTGLAFKNGLFIFMMRQFFTGIPDELEESAYVDGSGVYRTFLQIILPLSVPMMITIFLLSFSWQWTDNFYTNIFFSASNKDIILMPEINVIPVSLKDTSFAGQNLYESAIHGACALLIMAPLVVLYLFCQRYLIEGIERSGIVG